MKRSFLSKLAKKKIYILVLVRTALKPKTNPQNRDHKNMNNACRRCKAWERSHKFLKKASYKITKLIIVIYQLVYKGLSKTKYLKTIKSYLSKVRIESDFTVFWAVSFQKLPAQKFRWEFWKYRKIYHTL